MTVVMAMTLTVDSLLPWLKLYCDGGYDAAVKGPSIVVPKTIVIHLNLYLLYPCIVLGQTS